MDVRQEITSFLVNTFHVAPSPQAVRPDASLLRDLGLDSAGVFELLLWMEERFAIHLSPQDMVIANFETVEAAASCVERMRAGQVQETRA